MMSSATLNDSPAARSAISWKSRLLIVVRVLLAAVVLGVLATAGWLAWRLRLRPFPPPASVPIELLSYRNGQTVVRMSNGHLVGRVGQYPEELSAYLHFEYVQSLPQFAGSRIFLITEEVRGEPVYSVYTELPNDLIAQGVRLAEVQIAGFIPGFTLMSPAAGDIEEWSTQTRLFDAAYHEPVEKRLLQLPRSALKTSVADFIRFKIRTDRRVRKQIEPATNRVLSREDSLLFAADMIDVAAFYHIPLSMLLGIGAMENNYLDVRGDLKHAVWKKRALHGDTVLERRKGRVLVRNYALGPWQITRETLRHVHALYLRDNRDYDLLPERLRPPRKLDMETLDPHVLTTYAGLLLRRLLDTFDGNVETASGAYNGGPGRPNLQYAQGVDLVAQYARRVLSLAVERKAKAVEHTPLTLEVAKLHPAARPVP